MGTLDAEGRAALLRNVCRVNLFCMIGAVPGLALNAWVLWPSVQTNVLLAWSAVHALLVLALIMRDVWILSKPDLTLCPWVEPVMAVSAAVVGISVGASAMLMFATTSSSGSFIINTVTAGLLVNVIVHAGVKPLFWLGQIPIAVLSILAFGLGANDDDGRHVVLVLGVIGFSTVVASILRRYLARSVVLNQANDNLVSELLDANIQLAHDAHTDGLTGLLNRSGFVSKLEGLMAGEPRPVRPGDPYPEQIGVMFLDLDRFKAINDSFGHATGDQVLVQTAARLQAHVRPTDIVARMGGDEFTVAALGISSIAEARSLADRVRSAFDSPFAINGVEHQVGVSVGVSFGSLDKLDLDELLASADTALYEAKRTPGVLVAVFDDEARGRIRKKRQKEQEVAQALAAGQIRPHWQPIVSVDTGELRGLEGLARWEIDGEVRAAGSFIMELLDAGLEDELAETMLAATLDTRQAMSGQTALGMNLTPCQIERVVHRLFDAGSMEGLTIEITEQGILNNVEAARKLISEARSRGCRVFLDDFGTGYSSLSLIADLPLDGLKIDGRFIASIDDPDSFNIVADISEIGRRHGLQVVAEGVETVEQLEACAMLGVPLVQGFLISRPMTTADLKAMQASEVQPWDHLFGDERALDASTSEQPQRDQSQRDQAPRVQAPSEGDWLN